MKYFTLMLTALTVLVGVVAFTFFTSHVHDSHPNVIVIDGDTLDFSGFRVRILDIDTPEINTRTGILARDFVQDTINSASVVEARHCQGQDKYGRSLCLVYIDGLSLSTILINAHLAKEWK